MLSPVWGLVLWLFAGSTFPAPEFPFVDRRLWWIRAEGASTTHWRLFETRSNLPGSFPERLAELSPQKGILMRGIRTRPVFCLLLADLDNDGEDEVVAGVDRAIQGRVWRRLYLYDCHPTYFKPRWLGSRFTHRLLDIGAVRPGGPGRPVLLKTREKKPACTVTGLYRWDQFGFRLVSMQEETP